MQQNFTSLKAFDFDNSSIHLWVFKRSSTANRFSARFAQTDESLNAILLRVIQTEISRITEFSEYTYLAETNENSCLAAEVLGSDFVLLKEIVDRPEPDWRVRNIGDLKNASGYVVKFTHNNQTIYAVKRSASTWKTSYLKTHINIIFSNGELCATEDNGFTIEKTFDFYVVGDKIFITSKRAFESILEHRASYAQAFLNLQVKPAFISIFTDLQPLVNYVGTNSIQLRRMARIEERALYERPYFLSVVQAVSSRRRWGINFDPTNGKLIPCDQTAKIIMQVLLDHRLLSEVTEIIYDVPDAIQV